MLNDWSFGRKIGAGFAVALALTVVIGWIAAYALRSVVAAKDSVLERQVLTLIDAQKLETTTEESSSAVRGFLLTREQRYVDQLAVARHQFTRVMRTLRERNPDARRDLDTIARAADDYQRLSDELLALARSGAGVEAVETFFLSRLRPTRVNLRASVDGLIARQNESLGAATGAASGAASQATNLVISISILAVVVCGLLALLLTRTLSRQISSAVGQVQSSSAELQAAANQQATSSREQATAMAEITTTISELLATSRQIAESAQRVAQMADQTASSSQSGDGSVTRAHELMGSIQRQVETIVGHMLELGKKSQQIGTVLEIVSELAEQTNILSINATIEAAGAGDAGKRFAVVADEIRRLADRVAGSAKEIRALIDEVRSAVNTTVMVTETGSKAVDAGSRQFGEVASRFRQINGLVGNTTEAAREIELSTKQQTTAVEQVNVAIASVAQASKESETSSVQTLQTAAQLAQLSKNLLRLVEPRAN